MFSIFFLVFSTLVSCETAVGSMMKLSGVNHARFHDRVCVFIGPQGLNSEGEPLMGVACFVNSNWVEIKIAASKVTPFARADERHFPVFAEDVLESPAVLGQKIIALGSPEQLLDEGVVEAKARLIGLTINARYGFYGLVEASVVIRSYTPFVSRVFIHI